DSSEESMGTSTAQVILFGTIPTTIPTTIPIVDPPIVSTLPHTSPFLYIDLSDSDTSNRPPSQDPYEPIHVGRPTIPCLMGVSSEESYKPYTKLDIDFDVQADIDACIAAVGAATAKETDVRVEVDTRIDKEDEDDEEAESSHRGTMEIGVDIVVEPVMSEDTLVPTDEDDAREDFPDLVSADGSQERERAAMSERIRTLKRDNMRLRALLSIERERIDGLQCHMAYTQEDLRQIHGFCYYDRIETMLPATRTRMTPAAIKEMIERRVEEALEAYRNRKPIRENGDGHGDDNVNDNGNRNGDGGENGNGNGLGGGNGNGNPNVNIRGVVRLTRWFKKMEMVFHISNCPPKYQELVLLVALDGPEKEDWVEDVHRRQCGKWAECGQSIHYVKVRGRGYAGPSTLLQQCATLHLGRESVYGEKCNNLKSETFEISPNEAKGRVYTLGGGANLDSNVVTGTFLLNNHHARMLFDSGADRTFVSTTFSVLLDIVPYTLDLGLLGHPFDIDLMHVELGSFDVIIGMDWLSRYHVVIACDEKIIHGVQDSLWSLRAPSNAFWTNQRTGDIHGSDESGFFKIAKRMTKLTQKSVKFDWGEKEEAAFQMLKQKLCSAPILALPEGSENFVVYCDASHKGLGFIFMQREKVKAYASRQLKIHEKNYTTHGFGVRSSSVRPEDVETLSVWHKVHRVH
ncbi:putative reverse transcriptase domain-containing protein, partial [Tanacetum coccineum]